MSERGAASEAVVMVVKFDDLTRCVRCRRVVTPRRSLREGRCICGGIKVQPVGMVTHDDIREIERDYGWDNVILEGGREIDYAPGLLEARRSTTAYDGKARAYGLDEARFHSRNARRSGKEIDGLRRILVVKRWWADIPTYLRDQNVIRDAFRRLTGRGIDKGQVQGE